MELLKVQNIKKYYSKKLVLDVPEFSFIAGKKYSIIGPNGSGKSTFLNILALLDKPSEGSIFFKSENVWKSQKSLRSFRNNIVMVLQQPFLFNTSVFNNVAYGLKRRNVPKNKIQSLVLEMLENVGLGHFEMRNARELSVGEMQRVAIARAAVLKPEILLLDEPTSNLDHSGSSALEHIIRRIDSTVILSTQNIDQACRLNAKPLTIIDSKIAPYSIENLFYGKITNQPDKSFIQVSDQITFEIQPNKLESAHVVIEPSSIQVSQNEPGFKGKIIQITNMESEVKLKIQIEDIVLVAITSKQSFNELKLNFDIPVFVSFKPSDIKVF